MYTVYPTLGPRSELRNPGGLTRPTKRPLVDSRPSYRPSGNPYSTVPRRGTVGVGLTKNWTHVCSPYT